MAVDLSRELTNAEKLVFGAEAWVSKEGKIIERGIGNMFDRTKAAAAQPTTVAATPATVAAVPTADVPAAAPALTVAPITLVPVATPAVVVPTLEEIKAQIEAELKKVEQDVEEIK